MLNFGFYISVILLTLNQFTLVTKGVGINIYLFDLSVGLFSVFGFFYFFIVKRSFNLPKYSFLFLIFSLYACVSLIISIPRFSSIDLISGFFYLVRYSIYLLGSLVVYNMVDKKMIRKERVLNTFVLSGVLVSLLGFIQLILLPDFSILNPELGWDPHKNRLASTFFDPNFVGAYLVLCLIILMEKMFPKGLSVKIKNYQKIQNLTYLYFLVILFALFFTFSRSAWGMLAVVILIYGLFRSRSLLFVAFILSFLAYFAIPRIQTRISGITDPADSASLRVASWGNTMDIIKDSFWLGVGFNMYRYVQQEYGFLTPDTVDIHSGSGSDSSILLVMATTGVIGIIFYLLAFLFPLIENIFEKKENWMVIICLILGLLLESQFINSLFYPQIMYFTFCLLFIIPSHT